MSHRETKVRWLGHCGPKAPTLGRHVSACATILGLLVPLYYVACATILRLRALLCKVACAAISGCMRYYT